MEQHKVRVRVQVIDENPKILRTSVANYLPMNQLTQLIARESGLQAFWPNGLRRLYWLRARGRLLSPEETLTDIGIVSDELVYLLPQPPQGMAAFEQDPDYPENHPYLGQGFPVLIMGLFGIIFWAVGWGFGMRYHPIWWVSWLPSLGFGVWNAHFARHIWGGRPSQLRIFITAIIFMLLSIIFTLIPALYHNDIDVKNFFLLMLPGIIAAIIGTMLGWFAWWGPVEPLNIGPKTEAVAEKSVQLLSCGVCGGEVDPSVQASCEYRCGRIFHTGCYSQVKISYRDDKRFCAVCRERIS
jgi:hypothetical protein